MLEKVAECFPNSFKFGFKKEAQLVHGKASFRNEKEKPGRPPIRHTHTPPMRGRGGGGGEEDRPQGSTDLTPLPSKWQIRANRCELDPQSYFLSWKGGV